MYSIATDIWSFNILFFIILTGYHPFFCSDYKTFRDKINKGLYNSEYLEIYNNSFKNYFDNAFKTDYFTSINNIKNYEIFKNYKIDNIL